MSRYNLIDEPWIPVRYPDGSRGELGIRDTLLRAKEIAVIEDGSPLVVAALHRLLLAVLYRALEGPTDIDQAKALFKSGIPKDKVEAYLEKRKGRFWLFDETYPFYQVPGYMPKEKNGRKEWKSWPVISAEHNASNAKVLFDHVDVTDAGSVSLNQAARWLVACQAFALGGGNSDFGYTKSAPSATSVMVLPVGMDLQDTLLFAMVPENQAVLAVDRPVWEREPELIEDLKKGPEQAPLGYADLYTWRSRSIRFHDDDKAFLSELVLASGIGCKDVDSVVDPMVPFRINEKVGRLPVQFSERGLWRNFDSLLPDDSRLAPLVMENVAVLSRQDRQRIPKTVKVFGMSSDKAKIEFWRMEEFSLPAALAGDRFIRNDVRRMLEKAEDSGKALRGACATYAAGVLSRGDREPAKKDVDNFVKQMNCVSLYWSTLEKEFHDMLNGFGLGRDPDALIREWLIAVKNSLRDSWNQQQILASAGDAWEIRALVKAEARISRKLRELDKEISEYGGFLKQEEA